MSGRASASASSILPRCSYHEIEGAHLDVERLTRALGQLIERHAMLRAVVRPDGTQQVLREAPRYEPAVVDLRGEDPETTTAKLAEARERMSQQAFAVDAWPLFEVRVHLLDGDRARIHLGIDSLIMDHMSAGLLLREWRALYADPEVALPPLELTFRDYVLAERRLRDEEVYQRAEAYWQNRLNHLPPTPDLPLAKNPASLKEPRIVRHSRALTSVAWERLQANAAHLELSPLVLLCAAYADVLAVWSKNPQFTLGLMLFDRLDMHPQVGEILGQFTSLSLLAVDRTPATFLLRAQALRAQLSEALAHQCVNGLRVLGEISCAKEQARAAPSIAFSCKLADTAPDTAARSSALGEVIYEAASAPQVWIHCCIDEQPEGGLAIRWDVVEELFPPGLIDAMLDAYIRLLGRLTSDSEAWDSPIRNLIPERQLAVRAAVNATLGPVPPGLLQDGFLAQAAAHPDRIAVITPTHRFTYGEIARRASALAHRLRSLGARPNTLIGVVMAKGWEQVVAVMAILQAGAAYLPLDPALPKDRLWSLMERSDVTLALTQPWVDDALAWPAGVERLRISAQDEPEAEVEREPLSPIQKPEDLAYVIFTSGSTGVPKGVMIAHQGALNNVVDVNTRFDVGPEDRVLALAPFSFDLSVYDIFGVLGAGAALVIPAADAVRDPAHWAELMCRERVTLWNTAPAMMQVLVEYAESKPGVMPETLRVVMMSGDWIPVTLPDRIKALVKGVNVVSLGGATEASIWSIAYPVEQVDPSWPSIPYGRPMVNQSFHVLDSQLEPSPDWVPGYLYIGGIGLAKGYWKDEEKTNASFIVHPRTGERIYRTGDLGRYLPDGTIEILGREDFQVKIQGFRIELGEVEAALLQHENVRTAVVAVQGERHGRNKRLVGYIVPVSEPAPTADELRSFLRRPLPEYMVPAAFVTLECLPLTCNGKVDRQALPLPE